jgi:2-polyprenyl-6-methoxyphenol hydroxylase-like FAD-dependent oxidoreductase
LHGRHGDELGELDFVGGSAMKTGYGYMRVKRAELMDVLLEKVMEGGGVRVEWGKRVVGVHDEGDGVTVKFEDATSDTSDLVLGCDGIHSAVRTQYVDPEAVPQYSGISTIFAFLSVKDLPDDPSSLTCMHATFTQDGLFAIGPCTVDGDTLFWFFSHEVAVPTGNYESNREGWEEHRRTEVEGFKTKLLSSLKDVGGEWGLMLKTVVRQTKTVNFYPIFRLPIGRSWSRGQCLLLGDAAHAMQPHSGQGVSMALEDVFLFSRLLEVPSNTLPNVFKKFEKIRRPRIEKYHKQAAKAGDDRRRLGPWTSWFRDFVIWLGLLVFNALGLHRWGWSQRGLVYDIDDVKI